jgi:hypothetical protein
MSSSSKYPAERRRFMDTLSANRAEGILVLFCGTRAQKKTLKYRGAAASAYFSSAGPIDREFMAAAAQIRFRIHQRVN